MFEKEIQFVECDLSLWCSVRRGLEERKGGEEKGREGKGKEGKGRDVGCDRWVLIGKGKEGKGGRTFPSFLGNNTLQITN